MIGVRSVKRGVIVTVIRSFARHGTVPPQLLGETPRYVPPETDLRWQSTVTSVRAIGTAVSRLLATCLTHASRVSPLQTGGQSATLPTRAAARDASLRAFQS